MCEFVIIIIIYSLIHFSFFFFLFCALFIRGFFGELNFIHDEEIQWNRMKMNWTSQTKLRTNNKIKPIEPSNSNSNDKWMTWTEATTTTSTIALNGKRVDARRTCNTLLCIWWMYIYTFNLVVVALPLFWSRFEWKALAIMCFVIFYVQR